MREAPSFQVTMIPSRFLLMMASSEDATMAARRLLSSSASRAAGSALFISCHRPCADDKPNVSAPNGRSEMSYANGLFLVNGGAGDPDVSARLRRRRERHDVCNAAAQGLEHPHLATILQMPHL